MTGLDYQLFVSGSLACGFTGGWVSLSRDAERLSSLNCSQRPPMGAIFIWSSMFDHEEETVESLFSQDAEEPSATAPAPVLAAEEVGVPVAEPQSAKKK